MNERIQELINECTTISDDLVYDGESWNTETYEYFDKEKFAELIVQECIGVIGEENYTMLTGKAYCTELKRHFGVK